MLYPFSGKRELIRNLKYAYIKDKNKKNFTYATLNTALDLLIKKNLIIEGSLKCNPDILEHVVQAAITSKDMEDAVTPKIKKILSEVNITTDDLCLLYTSPSPRDA